VLLAPVTKPGEHGASGARTFTISRIAFAVLLKSRLTSQFVIEYCRAQLAEIQIYWADRALRQYLPSGQSQAQFAYSPAHGVA